jgi:polar amino acid transport system permease protein
MRWEWLPSHLPFLIHGLGVTLLILIFSVVFGYILSIPIALAQVTGSWPTRSAAKAFCSYIRGTPLLMQIWLLYYGLGSLFPLIPGMREHALWLIRMDAIYYGLISFTLSFAGYEAEIMRGAFLSVPRGELEAARSYGMTPFQVLRRVWFPSAVLKVIPTLTGEVIGQLKSTPLIFTIPVMDLMGATSKVRQDTYIVYEPLILLAVIYMILTYVITLLFSRLEALVPQRR